MAKGRCKLAACARPAYRARLCAAHYSAETRRRAAAPELPETIRTRIRRNSRVQPDGCWHWAGHVTDSGYGRVSIQLGGKKHTRAAHRVSYEAHRGRIPVGDEIDHACHTRAARAGTCSGGDRCLHRRCVNPEHLEPVSRLENMARSSTQVRSRELGVCQRGHNLERWGETRAEDGRQVTRCGACRRSRAKARRS